jgi:hypothetical protein
MGFGSTVDALLEFYSTCISLLKTPKSGRGGDGTVAAREYDERAQLRRSMRSDRAQVRRAYSSGLSSAGSRFEKGDGKHTLLAQGLPKGGVLGFYFDQD